jgi:hypothetical protein
VTPQSDSDAIDFKPFFDMIVGILFILLIFIAAQLFFTQWGDPAARERTRQTAYEWEQQAKSLLEDVAEQLRRRGVSAQVNTTAQSVTVPLPELLAPSGNGAVRIDPRSEAVGKVLADRLGCIPGQRTVIPEGCADLNLLHLSGIRGEARVNGTPEGTALTGERYAYYLATLLSAEFLRGAPELAGVSGSGGSPALRIVGTSRDAAERTALGGDLELTFSFEPPGR